MKADFAFFGVCISLNLVHNQPPWILQIPDGDARTLAVFATDNEGNFTTTVVAFTFSKDQGAAPPVWDEVDNDDGTTVVILAISPPTSSCTSVGKFRSCKEGRFESLFVLHQVSSLLPLSRQSLRSKFGNFFLQHTHFLLRIASCVL